ncbi:branched-chain amino acid ABC transporter permease [Halobacteriales archaeon Cl-PHB]
MPCGEYFTDYQSRMGLFRWRTQKIALVLALPIPFILPFVLGGGTVALLTQAYIVAIAVLGLNVILGYAGEIVLAQGAFMAIGAYSTSRLLAAGTGLFPALFVGGLMSAVVAVGFGLPSFRVKGFYIAISTLALQFIAEEWFFVNRGFEFIHGGTTQSLPSTVGVVGSIGALGTSIDRYLLALGLMLLFALLSLNLSRTGVGKTFRAVHENDLSAAVLGVNVFKNKLLAFAIGGFMIGVSGGLFGFQIGFINPEYFTLELTLEHYVMLLFGGLGRVWGALLGVGVVTLVQDYLQVGLNIVADVTSTNATATVPVFFGIIIIVVLAVEPKGVLAALGKLKEYLRTWPFAY